MIRELFNKLSVFGSMLRTLENNVRNDYESFRTIILSLLSHRGYVLKRKKKKKFRQYQKYSIV